jgi:hypothetical protein
MQEKLKLKVPTTVHHLFPFTCLPKWKLTTYVCVRTFGWLVSDCDDVCDDLCGDVVPARLFGNADLGSFSTLFSRLYFPSSPLSAWYGRHLNGSVVCTRGNSCRDCSVGGQGTDTYGDGDLSNMKRGYVYVTVVNNASQIVRGVAVVGAQRPSLCGLVAARRVCSSSSADAVSQWAMYCLVLFYHTLEHELSGLRPLPKLLAIKAVVFLTFWWVVASPSLRNVRGSLVPTLPRGCVCDSLAASGHTPVRPVPCAGKAW